MKREIVFTWCLLLVALIAVTSAANVGYRPAECYLPKYIGKCRGRLERWYFNSVMRKCEKFWYGGCKGNANKFGTKIRCERRCKPTCKNPKCKSGELSVVMEKSCSKPPCPEYCACVDLCDLPKHPGSCYAYLKRWYHNKSTGQCVEFFYRGCLGNANRFRSEAACRRKCPCRKVTCGKACKYGCKCSSGCPTSKCMDNPCALMRCLPYYKCVPYKSYNCTPKAKCVKKKDGGNKGKCPKHRPHKWFGKKCKQDKDCYGTMKCCAFGKYYKCTKPV